MSSPIQLLDLSQARIRSSEGAGTTILTIDDFRHQVFNLSAARTVVLPTTGVKKGMRYRMENQTAFALTVQSSGLNTIGSLNVAVMEVSALQDTPTTAAHWKISSPLVTSEIRLYGTNASGGSSSGETMVQNYGTVISNIGSAITFTARTTTTGDKFTINEAGIYTISASIYNPTNYIGLSRNSTQLSTAINAITAADALMITYSITGDAMEVSYTGRFAAGDVVRAHRSTSTAVVSSTDSASRFTIVQVVKF